MQNEKDPFEWKIPTRKCPLPITVYPADKFCYALQAILDGQAHRFSPESLFGGLDLPGTFSNVLRCNKLRAEDDNIVLFFVPCRCHECQTTADNHLTWVREVYQEVVAKRIFCIPPEMLTSA